MHGGQHAGIIALSSERRTNISTIAGRFFPSKESTASLPFRRPSEHDPEALSLLLLHSVLESLLNFQFGFDHCIFTPPFLRFALLLESLPRCSLCCYFCQLYFPFRLILCLLHLLYSGFENPLRIFPNAFLYLHTLFALFLPPPLLL